MATVDYAKAYKLGEKEYRTCLSKGIYPYLPVLEDIIEHIDIDAHVSLGLVQVPLNQVVGTYTAGRTTAFARNFMPILDTASEFAFKWSDLYDSLIEEGLRDPIKAYEFNNKFYVMEGNKRVSVSKFTGAVSIEANVTRIVPKKTDDPEIRLYYEFMEFYELTKINNLAITKEGNYKKLIALTGHEMTEVWSEEDVEDFQSAYTYFKNEYELKAGDKLTIGSGDAFCTFIQVFGYEETRLKTQADFKRDIARFWDEFKALHGGNDENVSIILNPTEESHKAGLSRLFQGNAGVIKVAFIHDSSIENSGWTYSHEMGRKYIQDVFGDKIETSSIERVDGASAEDVFEAAIEAGNKVIFSTTPKHAAIAVKTAVNHPDVKILNCSILLNYKNVRSYYLRTYEAKFIGGAIAGALANGESIGYLSDYPIRGTTAEINAFALGVQMTNPHAKVYLDWKMLKDHDPYEEFRQKNVRYISGKDMNANVDKMREIGLFKIEDDGSKTSLCMPVRHWGKLYEEVIRSIMLGAYKNDDAVAGDKSLNYFWGMSSGAVDVIYSRNLESGQIRLLRTLREGIRSMAINPFTGPIYDQAGILRCEDGKSLTPEEVVVIDWLASNVEGIIPDLSTLNDEAAELVKVQGIKPFSE